MKNVIRSLIATAVLIVLGSCDLFEDVVEGVGDMETRTLTLTPTIQGIQHTADQYNTGACDFPVVFLNRYNLGVRPRSVWQRGGGVSVFGQLVGYDSQLARGDDPFPCNLWAFDVFQGKAFFEMDVLPRGSIVQSARLNYSARSNPTVDIGDQSSPCTYSFGTAEGLSTAEIVFALRRENVIETRATRPQSAVDRAGTDVTTSVARWVRERAADTWIVVSPDPASTFLEHDESDERAQCHMYMSNLRLEITALVPPGS